MGDKEIPGLTDKTLPRRLGPKRASKIRKLFNLSKEDDVKEYVIKRPITKEGKKQRFKAPKIQRLVTPTRVARKRHLRVAKMKRIVRKREEESVYKKLLLKKQRKRALRERKLSAKRERLASMRSSQS